MLLPVPNSSPTPPLPPTVLRPKSRHRQQMPFCRAALWSRRFSQCLWHIHKFSSLLFCWLVLLNGLAGVLPSSSSPEEEDHRKLAEEVRKRVASNLTTSSEEEELTRQILTLFDYEEQERTELEAMERQAMALWNQTEKELNRSKNDSKELDLQFSMDSVANLTSLDNIQLEEKANLTPATLESSTASTSESSHYLETSISSSSVNPTTQLEVTGTSESVEQKKQETTAQLGLENQTTSSSNSLQIFASAESSTEQQQNQTSLLPESSTGNREGKNEQNGAEDGPQTSTLTAEFDQQKIEESMAKVSSPSTAELALGNSTTSSDSTMPLGKSSTTQTVNLMGNEMNGTGQSIGAEVNQTSKVTTEKTETTSSSAEITVETTTTNETTTSATTTRTATTAENTTESGTSSAEILSTATPMNDTTIVEEIEARRTSSMHSSSSTPFSSSSSAANYLIQKPTEVAEEEEDPALIAANGIGSGVESNLVKEEATGATGNGNGDDDTITAAILELRRRIQQQRPIGELGVAKLRDYRQLLVKLLASVDGALGGSGPVAGDGRWSPPAGLSAVQLSDFPKSKRFIAISASLPNWESAFFLDRMRALSGVGGATGPIGTNLDEIRKSPPHLSSSTRGPVLMMRQFSSAAAAVVVDADSRAAQLQRVQTTTTNSVPLTTTMPMSTSTQTEEKTTTTTTTTISMQQQQQTQPTVDAGGIPSSSDSAFEPSKSDSSDSSEQNLNNPKKTGFFRAESISARLPFDPLRNHSSLDECTHLNQAQLVNELKQRGTYNPELMAWDVSGVFRFLDRHIVDQYERQTKPPKSSEQAVRRNVEALEQLLAELNLQCEVRTPEVLSRLSNLTLTAPRRSIISPSLRTKDEGRHKRNADYQFVDQLVHSFNASTRRDFPLPSASAPPPSAANGHIRQKGKKQKLIGDVHVVPFGCDKRGYSEDGYLRLCGACQAIRKLPDEFFPPFINEVMCDEDKACLYFYNYPHGKCKQKHMNFVVLRNVGTQSCQLWQKFNLNVRVSCECFVDEMSFFAKYV